MPYPDNWIVSARNSSASGLQGVGLTINQALCRVPGTTASITMRAIAHSGSLFVAAQNTIVILTHSGMGAALGTTGTLRTLVSLNWFSNVGGNNFRTGVFCLRGTASAAGNNTWSGPCYAFAGAPANAGASNTSTWVLEKYPSGLSGTVVTTLLSSTITVSAQAAQPFSVMLSWVATASSVQLIGTGLQGVVSDFASYLSLTPTVSLTYLDTTAPLLLAQGAGLWVKDTQNGMLVTFDMTQGVG